MSERKILEDCRKIPYNNKISGLWKEGTEMQRSNPREVAAEALMEIMTAGAYSNVAPRRILRRNGAMTRQERAFVTETVNGTLRSLIYLDYLLNAFSSIPVEKMKPWLAAVVRTAAYQLIFMQVPDSAACNEAVKLAEARGYRALKGFVNGLLRRLARDWESTPLPEAGTAEWISVRYSHPLWLVKMWAAYYGIVETERLCAENNQPPDVSVRVNTLKTTPDNLRKLLEESGVKTAQGSICENALHLAKTADLTKLTAFQEGLFHIQDESSQLAVSVLDPQKGERVLDICAAPGGKSFTAAEKMENDGQIVSRDIHVHKIELMEETAARLGISCMECAQRDGMEPDEVSGLFDRVLADVPCSGLGLMRKKPDIRLKKTGSEIDSLIEIQRKILENAGNLVRPGGVLVYCTCTLSRKENEKNVEWFLAEHPAFEAEDITPFLPKEWDWAMETAGKGFVTLLPHRTGTDGFFIARMARKG